MCRRGATVKRGAAARAGAAARRSAARATTDIAFFFVRRWRAAARGLFLRLIAFRPFVCALLSGATDGAR